METTGYCENCPNPIECYQTGKCWPPVVKEKADDRLGATACSGSFELFSFCPGCGGALYKAVNHICPMRGLDAKWATEMGMTIDEYIAEYNATVGREEAEGIGADICSQNDPTLATRGLKKDDE